MEDRGPVQPAENERRCQIEGCNDVTVGARTSLCRKHRNNKYKQNYKKKKRKAQGSEENQGETPESQLAAEKYHLEQKYASMLQQVLVQKRLELLQSPSICNLLRIHQQSVREDKQRQLLEKRKAAQDEHNSKIQQEKQSKPLSSPNISTAGGSNVCNSGTTTKTTNGPPKTTSSGKTHVKSSKQSTRPPQARNSNKHSKTRNNSNSSVESTINGLVLPHSKITSNGSESVAHALYASSASWNLNDKKAEFYNVRQVQNFQQQQQIAPQQLLVNNTQQALSQPKQEQQQKASHNMQVQLLQHYQQQNIQKDHLQFLQHQNLLEQVHQKQLHEKKQQQQQHQLQQQQQQQRLQDQQFVHQQQQRRLQQQRQQELQIQLQNSRQQQQQLQQQQQRQQLQVSGLQNQQQVQFHQQQQLQTCTSSVTSSIKNISDTELLLQSLPSIQSSMSSLIVSQSLVNTSSHDGGHTSGILTTRPSVVPRTPLTNTQGKTLNTFPISHMGSNGPSVSSHRPIAPRLDGHPSINNTLCNNGMPIITAIISAPLTQQILPQSSANIERNSIHDANTLAPMNSSGNALNPPYPLMPFNVQMDLNLLQGVGAQFSEQNVQCASTQVRGRQLLLE